MTVGTVVTEVTVVTVVTVSCDSSDEKMFSPKEVFYHEKKKEKKN